MVDIGWIIETENELTDKAKFKLGDNYMLAIDLLNLFCISIKSFSKENEVAHSFETQIVKDFHLAVLNAVRRHTLVSNFSLRHAIESLVLFTYSFVNDKEEHFKVQKGEIGIVSFDDKILLDANKYFALKYPDISWSLEGYKDYINKFYSHSNIFSAQYNTAIIDEGVKLLIFDNYFDDYIRDSLLICNDIMCYTLIIYRNLQEEFETFNFEDSFLSTLEELLKRHDKLSFDHFEKNKDNLDAFEDPYNIINKLNKKYNK